MDENKDLVQHAEYVFKGKLIRKDYFSYTRYCSEYFAPKDNVAVLYQRTFYNEDGTPAYDILMNQGKEEVYRFKDKIFYGKQAFMRAFMKSLNLNKSDLVILDRETGIGQVVFEEAQAAHLAVVVHAEHYSENATNEDYILGIITTTISLLMQIRLISLLYQLIDREKFCKSNLTNTPSTNQKVVTIPVGSIDSLTESNQGRKPFSLITASRLAKEKHIDWLVKAVIEARKEIPELTFDIYGSGGEDSLLRDIIATHQAEDYIQLKGHAELSQIYSQYEVYLTASTSEGFGLTLMEAIGSGLPLIGFDVPYGNQTFIEDGQNGYLILSSSDHVEDQIKQAFSTKICQLYQENRLEAMRAHSYQIAEGFLTEEILKKWKKTVEEVLHD